MLGLQRVMILVSERKGEDLYMVGWSNGGSSLSGYVSKLPGEGCGFESRPDRISFCVFVSVEFRFRRRNTYNRALI